MTSISTTSKRRFKKRRDGQQTPVYADSIGGYSTASTPIEGDDYVAKAGGTMTGNLVMTSPAQIETDSITEDTLNNGVLIDGVLLKDGEVTGDLIGNVTGNVSGNVNGTTVQAGTITSTGSLIADTYLRSSDDTAVLGTASAGTIILRPTAYGSSTAQSTFSTTSATIGTPTTIAGQLTIAQTTDLGTSAGDSLLQFENDFDTDSNHMKHRVWAYRNAAGADWMTASIHDGISVDSSYGTPGTNTRCWYERDPQAGIHYWGNGATEYFYASSAGIDVTGRVRVSTGLYGDSNTDGITIWGGDGTGANIELYGGSHATLANRAYHDADRHQFRVMAGTTIMSMTVGLVDVTGDVEASGEITAYA